MQLTETNRAVSRLILRKESTLVLAMSKIYADASQANQKCLQTFNSETVLIIPAADGAKSRESPSNKRGKLCAGSPASFIGSTSNGATALLLTRMCALLSLLLF